LLNIKYNDVEDLMDHLDDENDYDLDKKKVNLPDGSHVYAPASRAIRSPAAYKEKYFVLEISY